MLTPFPIKLLVLVPFRMKNYNKPPQSGQVMFAQLMGMADYISSPLGNGLLRGGMSLCVLCALCLYRMTV